MEETEVTPTPVKRRLLLPRLEDLIEKSKVQFPASEPSTVRKKTKPNQTKNQLRRAPGYCACVAGKRHNACVLIPPPPTR